MPTSQDKPISGLDSAINFDGTEEIQLVQYGNTVKTTIDDIKAYINPIYTLEVGIKNTGVVNLFSTPIELIPSFGIGKTIKIISASYSLQYLTTTYSNTTLNIITDTANKTQWTLNGLNATVSRTVLGTQQIVSASTDTQLIADKGIYITAVGANPTTGNSGIVIQLTYQILSS
jgi:hypothetical protein